MYFLKTQYGLSDYEIEDRVNDGISFGCFCDLNRDQVAPKHGTISRFRTAMTKAKAFEPLSKEINQQLKSNQIIIKKGIPLDASVIDTPFRPK